MNKNVWGKILLRGGLVGWLVGVRLNVCQIAGGHKRRGSQHQEEVQQVPYRYRRLDGTDVTGGLAESEVPLLG